MGQGSGIFPRPEEAESLPLNEKRWVPFTPGRVFFLAIKMEILASRFSKYKRSLCCLLMTDTTTETLIYPGWETPVVPVSQPGTPGRDKRGCSFVPGLATGTKSTLLSLAPRAWRTLLSRLVLPTGTKGPFFSVPLFLIFFYFNYTFTFQLNLCIGIQCVRSPLIYTYIYSYLYNICPI